jgi:hypothetical protein
LPKVGNSPYRTFNHNINSIFKRVQKVFPNQGANQAKIRKKSLYKPTGEKRLQLINEFAEWNKHTEKSRYFESKLAHLLADKPLNMTVFQIYSSIFSEFADYLPEFKELLVILKRGLVVSGIKEKDFAEFEYKNDSSFHYTETAQILDKERKENLKLVSKLNAITNENQEMKHTIEKLTKENEENLKIINSSPKLYIEAEKLLEKMTKQSEIIRSQKSQLNELKYQELILKKSLDKYQQGTHEASNPSLSKKFHYKLFPRLSL